MINLVKHQKFQEFEENLNSEVRPYIMAAVSKMERGLFGDWKSLGEGLIETRIDHGAGWRIYYIKKGDTVVILLGGGSKKTQQSDINAAKLLIPRKKPKP